jgi:hypothetical protein
MYDTMMRRIQLSEKQSQGPSAGGPQTLAYASGKDILNLVQQKKEDKYAAATGG